MNRNRDIFFKSIFTITLFALFLSSAASATFPGVWSWVGNGILALGCSFGLWLYDSNRRVAISVMTACIFLGGGMLLLGMY